MDPTLEARLREAGVTQPLTALLSREGEEISGLRVPADDALELWEKLRDAVPATGHWPVLLAAPLARVRQEFESDPRPVSELLRAADAAGPDPRQWILAEFEQTNEELDENLADWRGDWPEHVEPVVDLELEVEDDQLYLALVPTARGAEAAAHLRFSGPGNWPAPEQHLALLRAWEDAFAAQVVAMGGAELVLRVSRPPQGREAAMLLAEAQMLYTGSPCDRESLEELAAHRMVDEIWQLRWSAQADDEDTE